MKKYITLAFLVLVMSLSSVYFYFFGLLFVFENNSNFVDVNKIECRTNSNKTWQIDRIKHGNIVRTLFFLSSGDALICNFVVNNVGNQTSVVVGYFNERIRKIHAVMSDTNNSISIRIFEVSNGAKRLVDEKKFPSAPH